MKTLYLFLFNYNFRCVISRTRRSIHSQIATVLCAIRFYGSCGRPEGQGGEEVHPERAGRLYNWWQGRSHRTCLSRNYQNG